MQKYVDFIENKWHPRSAPQRLWTYFRTDSLFRNSIYLMLSTGIMAGLGFFFWLINAHTFSAENIGLATTLISTMNTIAILSLFGFDSAIVRFVPNSKQRNEELNTALILVGVTALILGALFVLFIRTISPPLGFIFYNRLAGLAFALFCVMCALNILTDSVFLAYRETKYTLIINTIFSSIKVTLPFLFIRWGALGIFTSAAAAQTVGFALSIGAMIWKLGYKPKFVIHKEVLERVWHYCTGNYIAGIFTLMPPMLLPIIITNRLGEKQTAFYYIVTLIGSLLYIIPQAATSSLFAEGSHEEQSLNKNIKKVINIVSWMLIPAVAATFLFGRFVLQIFGKSYSTGGLAFLYFVATTGLVVSVTYTFGSMFKVMRDIKSLIITNFVYAVTILGLSSILMPLGLFGVGIAWFCGYSLSAIVSFLLYRWRMTHENYHKAGEAYVPPRFDDIRADMQTVFISKLYLLYASIVRGFKRKTILFYPEKPEIFHSLYRICHFLGYTMTNDPSVKADAVFAFDDTTIRKDNPILDKLCEKRKVINCGCGDISKVRVEKIFKEVFGYGTFVDPSNFIGECLMKTDANAVHDGKLVTCPIKAEKGFVYQKVINNVYGDEALDIRVPIFNENIPFICLKYKKLDNRFGHSERIEVVDVNSQLNHSEISKIKLFCNKFGLEYGELDVLRDKDDGKIYIIDANNTPADARSGRNLSKKVRNKLLKKTAEAFSSAFLN